MRERIQQAMKDAMKSGDKRRLSTLRLVTAAIKDRDIAGRVDDKGQSTGKDRVEDSDILALLQKMIKQRRESVEIYTQGGRQELAEQETAEIAIIEEFLPAQMGDTRLRWRGVRIDQRVAFQPESLTASEILQERNAELRRVKIERMGALEFAQQANAQVLDEDRDPGGPRRLLRIDLQEDEPLVGLNCRCPSTGREYLLRVPPQMKSCHQAAAWIAGFDDPSDYHPDHES